MGVAGTIIQCMKCEKGERIWEGGLACTEINKELYRKYGSNNKRKIEEGI